VSLPPITYLTFDSLSEWIGLSQVVPYLERLAARGVDVRLHSFEKGVPDDSMGRRLAEAGVQWEPHRFGAPGAAGGVARVLYGAALVAGADLVHARGDLAAASCLLARRPAWVWDMRALWREQRLAQGLMRPGSVVDRIMRRVESAAAASSTAIITLSTAALGLLAERHGAEVAAKGRVVTTCVDLNRFQAAPFPAAPPVRYLLAGTLNRLYDVPTMTRLVERAARRGPADLTLLTTDAGPWTNHLRTIRAEITSVAPTDMPEQMREHHIGLCVLRLDAGSSSRAAMPTKLGEFLAAGRPVVVSAGLGDMEGLIAAHNCGAVVRDTADEDLDRVVGELDGLLADPGTAERCRALAESHFSLDRAVNQLLEAYRQASAL
jgi:glycosyltransferase involved in cell wall biosynthesis